MTELTFVIICGIILYLLSQGAPYVPTRRKDVQMALELMDVPPGAMIADVGAGDGVVVKLAAERGFRAVGIELNPFLWLVATFRVRRHKDAHIIWGNMWRWQLPDDTKAVFLFTAGPFAKRLTGWLETEQKRLGKPLKVVSLGFELPGLTSAKTNGACILYTLG